MQKYKVIYKIAALSLKCFRCISGKCQTSSTYFGTEKTCNGADPVCVRQTRGDGNVTRDCQYSFNYAPLKGLDGQCVGYNGKQTCYCTGDKCNSSLENQPVLVVILMTFGISMILEKVVWILQLYLKNVSK